MITLNLQPLFKLKGITSPYAFLKRNGFSHYHAHALARGTVRSLHFQEMERLCRALNCMPHDLLDYAPSPKAPVHGTDQLLELCKQPAPVIDLREVMHALPPSEARAFAEELIVRFRKAG